MNADRVAVAFVALDDAGAIVGKAFLVYLRIVRAWAHKKL
jgi:hypothetical protein